jgi:tetratricopeptide (TPR) repeat protein
MIKILFLAPNPSDTARLGLDEEYREIKNRLNREKFELDSQWAVRPREILKSVMEGKPHIVHFSGHGLETGELCVQDDEGNTQLVSPEALAALFRLTTEHVKCVVINTCYSRIQARAIAEHIPFVIGMEKAIGDKAAIEFAIGFYAALESDQSIERIEKAFEFGRVAIHIGGIPAEHLTPVLILGDPRNRFRAEVEQLRTQLQKSGSTSAIIFRQALLERGRRMGLSAGEAESVTEEVLAIIKLFQARLEKYKKTFTDALRDEFPLEEGTQEALKFLQEELGLRDEDVSLIEKEILDDGRWRKPEAFFDRGVIQFTLGEYEKALKYFTQAIELRPRYSGAFLERGATQAKLKDFKASIADLNSAIEINSNWDSRSIGSAYFERGFSYYDLALQENHTENMEAAIKDWSESIRLRPNSSPTYYNRALAYVALDKNEEAIQDYTTAIQVNSEWGTITIAHAYHRRAIAYRAINDFSAANEDLRQIAELNRENPDLRQQHPNLSAVLDLAEIYFGEQTDLVDNKPVMEQL